MKYMLMMHVPGGAADYQIDSWSPADLEAHIGFMHRLNKELTESGELAAAEGLAAPGEAKVVRARAHLFEMAGDEARAIQHYRAAAQRTTSIPERNYLTSRAARLAAERRR